MRRESKLPTIIIIVLVVIILGLGVFICFDKGVFGKKKPSNVVVEEKDYDLSKAKKLLDKYYFISLGVDTFSEGMTNEVRNSIAIFNLAVKYEGQVSCSSIYNNNPIAKMESDTSYSIIDGDFAGGCDENLVPFYKYDDVNEVYKDLFGEGNAIPKESFKFEALVYDYNKTQDGFVKLSCRCGGGYFNRPLYFVKSAKVKEDKLVIEAAYINLEPAVDDDSNDPVLEASIKDEKVSYKFSDTFKDNFEKEFSDKYLDKMDAKYEFTFIFNEDHYVLSDMIEK